MCHVVFPALLLLLGKLVGLPKGIVLLKDKLNHSKRQAKRLARVLFWVLRSASLQPFFTLQKPSLLTWHVRGACPPSAISNDGIFAFSFFPDAEGTSLKPTCGSEMWPPSVKPSGMWLLPSWEATCTVWAAMTVCCVLALWRGRLHPMDKCVVMEYHW